MDNDNKTPIKKDKTNSLWNHDDKATLVCTLKMCKVEGKWGDNNPKDVTWTLCVTALSSSEKMLGGVAKNVKANLSY